MFPSLLSLSLTLGYELTERDGVRACVHACVSLPPSPIVGIFGFF